MASHTTPPGPRWLIGYILVIWFVISFVTNLLGPLMPVLIKDFHLSLALAGFLPFSFFLAYGLISIPAGALLESRGAASVLTLALLLNFSGSLWIALLPGYSSVVVGLFIIGLGMAMLQVVINPLMRSTVGEAEFAFYSVAAQLVFGLASFLSPYVYTQLIETANAAPGSMHWLRFYWIFLGVFLALLILTRLVRLPEVELRDDEKSGGWSAYRQLIKQPQVWYFFLGIVAYVGTEQSLANWMAEFLQRYHQLPSSSYGADAVAWFWGLMSLGCLLGLLLLKLFDSKQVLASFSVLAALSVASALFGPAKLALYAFPAAGFFLSVMFSIVFSLALNSRQDLHGAFSGILCSGILGGAILPMLVGLLGDYLGLRTALCLVFVSIAYLFSLSFWAKPLVSNQTLSFSQLIRREKPLLNQN